MPLKEVQRMGQNSKVPYYAQANKENYTGAMGKTGRAPTPLENAAQFLLIDPVKDSAVLFLGNEGNVGNVAKTAQDPMDIYKRRGVYGS